MIKTPEKPIESGEAEQTILGALLIRPENIAEILAKIRPEDFYHENHRLIFQAMTDLEESGAPIDYNSVSLELKKSNSLGKIGGIEFLMKLAEQVGFASNYPFFVDVVHEKASLRRFADITARANRAAFNGHRFNSLLLETQEKLASLAAGAGRVETGITIKVRDWIKLAPGQFEVRQIYNDLGILAPGDKKTALMALGKAEKEGLIEKTLGRRGQYRIVEARADKIDFLHADSSNWLDLILPLGIEKYVRLFPGNIIIVAGEKGSGKTAFCLDTARLNRGKFPIRYLSSEMAAEELRDRLEKFGLLIEEWEAVDFRARRDNFADLIDPDGINFIDFLEKYDQFWTIAADIRGVFDKLRGGVCFIAIQKDKGAESGRGGMFTREKCRLHVALSARKDPQTKARINEARIDDVKVFGMPGYNPNGLVLRYNLIQGASFSLAETGAGSERENW